MVLQALWEPSPNSREILSRSTNPAGTIDAVVATFNGGATVALGTEIHFVPQGEGLRGDPVFRADHVEGVSLRWTSDYQLSANIKRARTFLHRPTYGLTLPGHIWATGVGADIRVAHPEN